MSAPEPQALLPLLPSGSSTTVEQLGAIREAIHAAWSQHLGPLPTGPAPLETIVLATEVCDGFTRARVRYQAEVGVWIDAYLLRPAGPPRRRAAVVAFHQTTRTNIDQVAGLDCTKPELMQGVQLVQRGYIVLCPRCFIFDDEAYEAVGFARNLTRLRERHPHWTGLTRMTWDARRAIDLLVSLDDVDVRRIGCIGHSLGAREALYAGAFDERCRVAVFNEGGISVRASKWMQPWYLGAAAAENNFALDHHQLLTLIAPRAFLLLAGDAEDRDASRAYVDAAQPVFKLLGAPENLAWFNHRGGHHYPPEARRVAEAFLERHLQPDA